MPRRLQLWCVASKKIICSILTLFIAFDDQSSTFIIPSGSGFEVRFCPGGRSTNIIATSNGRLTQLAQTGHVRRDWDLDLGDLDLGDLFPSESEPTPTPTPEPSKQPSHRVGRLSSKVHLLLRMSVMLSFPLAYLGLP